MLMPDRPATALIVIDVQAGVVQTAHRRDDVVANVARLVDAARAAGNPVVWVQHDDEELVCDSDGWQLAPGLEPANGEARIRKNFRSSFEQTDLEDALAALGAGHLVLCGAETNFCVRHTLHSALERGYDVTLVGDAHTASDIEWQGMRIDAAQVIDDMNLGYADYRLPGRRCVVTTTEAAFV